MSRISNAGGGALPQNLCLVVTLLLVPVLVQAAEDQQPKKTMPIQATVSVTWDVEGGGTRNQGSMTMRMRGTAHLAEEVSVMDPAAPPGTMITYAARGVKVNYTYKETETQEHPPRDCPALMAEYEGNGVFSLEEVTSAMTSGLNIRKMGSLIPKEMLQFVPAEAKGMMIDYYDFFAVAKKQEAQGKRRGWNDCNFVDHTREFNPTGLTIRFQITDEGEMTGSRTWSVKEDSGRPSFTIRISDLPENMERRPLVPEPSEGGDVTYAVSWNFGEVDPVVEIERKQGPNWIPLGDEPVDVKVGEKIELRGTVLPEEMDTGKGDWTVPGKRVKGFKVEGDTGKKDELEQKDLAQTPTVTFHWYDGGENLQVTYETKATNGKSLQGKAAFNVQEPELKMNIDEPPCDFVAVDVVWKDEDGLEHTDRELLCDAPGTSYSIRFHHDPLPAEFPGSTQYVQIVNTQGLVRRSQHARTQCDMISRAGLDETYPYSAGPEATDRPGADLDSLDLAVEVMHTFRMSLMYKPNGEGAIFVPIREAQWWWGGMARRANEYSDNWDTSGSEMGSYGSDVQAKDFLEWNQVVRKDDQWEGCE